MMIKRGLWLLAAAVALSFGHQTPTKAETIKWQDHHLMPAGFWFVQNQAQIAKELLEETNGRLKINILPSGSAGFKGPETLGAVSENLVQIGYVAGGLTAGQERVMELLDLPQFVPGDFEFRKKLWDTLRPMYRELLKKKYNVWLMDMIQFTPRRLYTKVEVKSLDDLKGLKIRAIGPADSDFINALGARATTTAWVELYTALQQGVVDGHMASLGPHLSMRFDDATKFIFDTENAGPSVFTVVSQKAIDDLPKDIRKALYAKEEVLRQRRRTTLMAKHSAAQKALLARGSVINPVPEKDKKFMREVAAPIVKRWAEKLDPDSRIIYDKAREMIDAYYKNNN